MDTQLEILNEIRGLRKEVNDGFQNYEDRITAIETKLEPLVRDASFKRRIQYIGNVISGSVGAALIVGVLRFVFPHYVPPPSILGK
jgi:hypothetical protein